MTALCTRHWLPALAAAIALVVAGCGSSSSSTSSAPAATSSAPATSAPATSAPSSSSKNGIPQGPNAGDQDSDNNGGASDGDGNL